MISFLFRSFVNDKSTYVSLKSSFLIIFFYKLKIQTFIFYIESFYITNHLIIMSKWIKVFSFRSLDGLQTSIQITLI